MGYVVRQSTYRGRGGGRRKKTEHLLRARQCAKAPTTQPRTTVPVLVAAQCHLYLLHTEVSQAIAGDSLPLCQDQLCFPVTSKKPGFSFTESTEAPTLHALGLDNNPLSRTFRGQSAFPHYDGRAFCAPKANPSSRHEIGGPSSLQQPVYYFFWTSCCVYRLDVFPASDIPPTSLVSAPLLYYLGVYSKSN